MNSREWRLIQSGHLSAAQNMAVDEALLISVLEGESPPVLRVYGWSPPGVSLGYFQSVDSGVNLAAICERGYDLVRRPTGGRAIIHRDEVTYSVAIRADELAGGPSIMQSYRDISQGVETGLARLGVTAHIPKARRSAPVKSENLPSVCFAKTLGGDMTAKGRKIVGSAQVRRSGAILQHGSVPISFDLSEHMDILGGDAEGADEGRSLTRAAVGVAEVLEREVSFDELAQAIVDGFTEAFGVELQAGELSEAEQENVRRLVAEKYGNRDWVMTPGRKASTR